MEIEYGLELGRGFFGAVYQGRDVALGREVAVKLLNPQRLSRPVDELFSEAQALLQAQHRNVVDILGAELQRGHPAIVMEYLPGGSVGAKTERAACGCQQSA